MREEWLTIECLRFSRKKRRGVSPKRVEELRQKLEAGEDIFPILVSELHDGTYVVSDGRHRIEAHLKAGVSLICARIKNIIEQLKLWLFGWSLSRR